MTPYETTIKTELQKWENKMQQRPSMMDKLAKRLQIKMNSFIPEKVHHGITVSIKQMIKAVLLGAKFTTKNAITNVSFEVREAVADDKISFYQKTAATEGGLTGAGGLLLGLADFPLLLGIKLKLLFELAATYGYDVEDYKERLYILYIFQLAFCSRQQQHIVYRQIADWQQTVKDLPEDINEIDWRTLQQEYRDYIDLAKMAQLVPVIGAPVGAVVNYRLIRKLGEMAKNAYRLRYFSSHLIPATD